MMEYTIYNIQCSFCRKFWA